jgi:TrmH family RNA methyltransferase
MTKGAVRQIASAANPFIKDLRALHMKKRRDETGLFLAEGARVVIEALDCGWAAEALVYASEARENDVVRRLRDRVLAAGGDAVEVGAAVLGKIARKDNPQNVLGVFRQRVAEPAAIRADAGVVVALEGVKDPGNLGTVIRTADAVGAAGVILVGATCDPFSVEAVRATMGSLFAVPIHRADLDAFLALCRGWRGPIVGTALQSARDYREVDYPPPVLLVMGAEQSGLSDRARAACTALVRLPMKGRADSLNLSVSTGVMLYHIESQQRAPVSSRP